MSDAYDLTPGSPEARLVRWIERNTEHLCEPRYRKSDSEARLLAICLARRELKEMDDMPDIEPLRATLSEMLRTGGRYQNYQAGVSSFEGGPPATLDRSGEAARAWQDRFELLNGSTPAYPLE